MKKLFSIVVLTMLAISIQAQDVVPLGIVDGKPSQAKTTIYVGITVEQQEILAGPYVRYAQKYLGVSAPLSDKLIYEIRGATISVEPAKHPQIEATAHATASHMNPTKGFPKLLIDRMYNSAGSLEDNARLAADRIFDIRKSRYELITGEVGENVFGAGLGSALAELDKLEEEYLSLFLGKQTTRTIFTEYKLAPTADKENYIVGRFSAADGLLPVEDLSGEPIILEITPLGNVSENDILAAGFTIVDKPSKTDRAYGIADDVVCRVISGATEIASETIPVFQFGRTLYLR
jgi:hypothetical protein